MEHKRYFLLCAWTLLELDSLSIASQILAHYFGNMVLFVLVMIDMLTGAALS
jgi:hypothetical protein